MMDDDTLVITTPLTKDEAMAYIIWTFAQNYRLTENPSFTN